MANDRLYGATPKIFEQARQLRESMTPAERLLWEPLKMNRLRGVRFKAQHPTGYFIADFHSHKVRLVIELDGGVHDFVEQREYDASRTNILESLGLNGLRFRNEGVINRLDSVLAEITRFLSEKETC
jgi:very-short-patch-repair endonuclease